VWSAAAALPLLKAQAWLAQSIEKYYGGVTLSIMKGRKMSERFKNMNIQLCHNLWRKYRSLETFGICEFDITICDLKFPDKIQEAVAICDQLHQVHLISINSLRSSCSLW
jgi:hypothetical protein